MEQHGGSTVDETLGMLRHTWGDAYGIIRNPDGSWDAVSKDAEQRVLTGGFPAELEERLRADRARAGLP